MKIRKGTGFLLISILMLSFGLSRAQETQSVEELKQQELRQQMKNIEGARPDLPGVLGFDLGFVMSPDFPEEMKMKFWPSFYFRGFYKWDLFLGQSNFLIQPGISFASEKYTFKNDVTINSVPGDDTYNTVIVGLDSILNPDASLIRSQFNTVYFGIPLEISYLTNREMPRKGFKITVGANFDFRINSKTKIKYEQGGEKEKAKQKEKFDTAWYRINLTARFGYGSVALFYNYSLTPLFEGDKGPLGTTAQPMSFGVSLDLF